MPRFATFQGPKLELGAAAKAGLVLLAMALALAGGLRLWRYKLNQQTKILSAELQRLTGQRDMSLENRLKNLNIVLDVFKGVLDEHRHWSVFFKLLEDKTMPAVVFKSFNGNDKDFKAVLAGSAPSYNALAQQVKVFEDAADIDSVKVSNITLSEAGRVNFSLEIGFAKELLIKK